MLRIILIYGSLLAAASLVLAWAQFHFLVRAYPLQAWVALVALAFLGLGIWVGARLFQRPKTVTNDGNPQARNSLGISEREMQVLELLAKGRSNKEIALELHVSPNTVKTHVARLFEKLDVKRRTEAIVRARELGLVQ